MGLTEGNRKTTGTDPHVDVGAATLQRPQLQHLHRGLLQPRLEAGCGPQTPGSPRLLETYSAECAPVAEQIVKRANKFSREFGQFFEVLSLTEAETEQEIRAQIEEPKADTPRGRDKREALVAVVEPNDHEFNAHGVDLGQSCD